MFSKAVKLLTDQLQKTKIELQPRQKFSFKSKVKTTTQPSDTSGTGSKEPSNNDTPSDDTSTASRLANPPHPKTPEPKSPEDQQSGPSLPSPDMAGIRRMSLSRHPVVKFSNHTDQHIFLTSSAAHATTSGTFSKLTRSIISTSTPTKGGQPFSSLMIRNVDSSLVIAGSVDGPAHITDVRGSVIVVTCRQFRLHASEDVDVYLCCGSRPIIEGCKRIRFAPLPEVYVRFFLFPPPPPLSAHSYSFPWVFGFFLSVRRNFPLVPISTFTDYDQIIPLIILISLLPTLFTCHRNIMEAPANHLCSPSQQTTEAHRASENKYDQVDDFDWLKSEQSPNWSILDPSQRIEDRLWRDVVPGTVTLGVKEILRAVGIPIGKEE